MTALDFLMVCAGLGVVGVAAAWSYRIISEVRGRNRMFKDAAGQGADEPDDVFSLRLKQLNDMRFGRPMVPPVPVERPLPRRPLGRVVPIGSRPKKEDK